MKQGEIWLIDLDPTKGAEIQKKRPAIIINDDALGKLPLKIVIPITDWKEHYSKAPWMIQLTPDSENGLSKDSAADCFQLRSLSEERLIKRMGIVDDIHLEKIKAGIKKVLSME